MITDEQMIWVATTQCPGLGVKRFEQLRLYLETIKLSILDFWQLSSDQLQQIELKQSFKDSFSEHKKSFAFDKLKKELEAKAIFVVCRDEKLYPELLREIPDAPPVLFVHGVLKEKFSTPVAVVGTRKITSYGRMATQLLTRELVQHGCEIISGFMYGVDAVAHQTAIDTGGYTVGVLGYGFDHLYPASHAKLKHQILEKGGVLFSEYLPSTPPIIGQFPQRNRIVAGLSKGVLVTEAAVNSGSKITARLAAEYGRDVFAVPGPITSQYSEGTKDLINTGAKLVTCAEDILEEYYPKQTAKSGVIDIQQILSLAENETEKRILELLFQQSVTSDEIANELMISSGELLSSLSLLEMKGAIGLEGGKYFVRF